MLRAGRGEPGLQLHLASQRGQTRLRAPSPPPRAPAVIPKIVPTADKSTKEGSAYAAAMIEADLNIVRRDTVYMRCAIEDYEKRYVLASIRPLQVLARRLLAALEICCRVSGYEHSGWVGVYLAVSIAFVSPDVFMQSIDWVPTMDAKKVVADRTLMKGRLAIFIHHIQKLFDQEKAGAEAAGQIKNLIGCGFTFADIDARLDRLLSAVDAMRPEDIAHGQHTGSDSSHVLAAYETKK